MNNITRELTINGLQFVMTCFACPEQYDVFDRAGKQVGYVRLRHGKLRCDYPDCGSETIYEADPVGDGCFDSQWGLIPRPSGRLELVTPTKKW